MSLANSGAFGITLADVNGLALGTVQADVGNINVTAGGNVTLQTANITTTTGNVNLTSSGGALNMGSSGVIHTTTGGIQLAGANGVTLGTLFTTSNASVDSIFGSIVDGGAAGPAITAAGTALHATTGIGVSNPLRTSVNALAASTASGVLQVSNDNGGSPLTIGNVGSMSGVQSAGSQISIVNQGSLVVDTGVFSTGGGSVTLLANGSAASDLAIHQPVRATGGSGSVNLSAAGDVIMSNPSGANPLIQVTGSGQILVSAGGTYAVGPNVVLQSGTGKATAPAPTITNIVIPQITSFGIAMVTALFGPDGESNVSLTVDWSDGATSTATVATLANVLFEHQYLGHPDGKSDSAAPISITITAHNDPNIIFAGANQIIVQTQAATPGTGLAVFFISLTPEPPPLNTFIYRVDAAPQTMISSPVSAPTTEVVTAPSEVKVIEVRQLVLNVIAPDGTVQPVPMSIEVLNDLPSLFKQLPDGRYRLQLTEPGSSQQRVVIDVELRDGRPFDPADDSEDMQDRPPSSDTDAAPAPAATPPTTVPLGWLESTIVGGVGITIAAANCEMRRTETSSQARGRWAEAPGCCDDGGSPARNAISSNPRA